MFLSKIIIFLTLVLFTKQELYWNFISSEELNSKDNLKMFDFSQFTMYNNLNIPTIRFCLIFLSVEHVFISEKGICNTHCSDEPLFVEESVACHLHGLVTKAQFLRSYDNRDGLIFVQLEGCYSIDENGSISSGTILVTNDVNKKYIQKLNVEYFWTKIESHQIECKMFCQSLAFERCFVEMNENVTAKYLRRFQNVHDIFYLKPIKPESTLNGYNENIVFISLCVVVVILSVLLLISLVYRKGIKIEHEFT